MRLLHRWVVGGDCCGAGGLAQLAMQWLEWILGLVEGTLGLIGRPANELFVAVGVEMPVIIAHSDLLWLYLVHVGAVGLLHRWYVYGGYSCEGFALSGERSIDLHHQR